jgi:hypothetical protein
VNFHKRGENYERLQRQNPTALEMFGSAHDGERAAAGLLGVAAPLKTGWREMVRVAGRPRKANDAHPGDRQNGESDWQHLFDNIREGRELHNSLRDLAAKMIAASTNPGAAIHQLRTLMEASTAPKDERWRARVSEIPRAVDSAVAKYGKRPEVAELTAAVKAPPEVKPPPHHRRCDQSI